MLTLSARLGAWSPPQREQPEHCDSVPSSPPGSMPSDRTGPNTHQDTDAHRPLKILGLHLFLLFVLCQVFSLSKRSLLFAFLSTESGSLEICLPVPVLLRHTWCPGCPCLLAPTPPPILLWMEAIWLCARPMTILPWMRAERQYACPPPILPQMEAERQYANSGVIALIFISAAFVTIVAAVFVYSRHATTL